MNDAITWAIVIVAYCTPEFLLIAPTLAAYNGWQRERDEPVDQAAEAARQQLEDILAIQAPPSFRYTTPVTGRQIALIPLVNLDQGISDRISAGELRALRECAADGSTRLNLDAVLLVELPAMFKAWGEHSYALAPRKQP